MSKNNSVSVLKSKTSKIYKDNKLNNANFGNFTNNDYRVFLHLVSKILLNQKISNIKKIVSLLVILIICNIPVYQLEPLPIFFKFLRLWFTILLSFLFFSSFAIKPDYKWFIFVLIVLLPLHLEMFKETKKSISTYVLKEKKYFCMTCSAILESS